MDQMTIIRMNQQLFKSNNIFRQMKW